MSRGGTRLQKDESDVRSGVLLGRRRNTERLRKCPESRDAFVTAGRSNVQEAMVDVETTFCPLKQDRKDGMIERLTQEKKADAEFRIPSPKSSLTTNTGCRVFFKKKKKASKRKCLFSLSSYVCVYTSVWLLLNNSRLIALRGIKNKGAKIK